MENAGEMPGRMQRDPSQATEVNEYNQGDVILTQGEESPFFQVILSGRVRLAHYGKKIRVLSEQDIFGLESIILKSPPDYSVVALEKSRIAKYGPEALDHFTHESPRMVWSILNSMLQQLSQTTQAVIDHTQSLDEGPVRFYSDQEIVIGPDSRETEIYRLVSTQGGLEVRMGETQVGRIDKPGEFFGFLTGLFEVPRQSTVVSIGESVLEIYSLDDLDMLIRDHPDAARRIMMAMMLRLAEINRKETGGQKASD